MQSTSPSNWKPRFFLIWSGQQISLLGSNLAGFALTWWITRETGSAVILSTLTMVMMLPGVFLGPFIGALVDRWNRRLIMLVADSTVALFSAWLGFLFWSGRLELWHIYVIMLIRAIGGTFHDPAMAASTSLMVPREQLARVSGLNQTMMGIRNIVGSPLGAWLMTLMPVYGLMAIDVLTALVAIGPLLFVHIPQPTSPGGTQPTHFVQDVREGLLYVWHWPGLFIVLVMATLINLVLTPAFTLLPLLITRNLDGGAIQLGLMNSAWGVGVILGGALLSIWG
ncbi:MFS transporter, partial [Candidatus Parcubacteria bacterium]